MTDSKLSLRIALATALLSTTAFADGHFSSDPAIFIRAGWGHEHG
jgi:hypothetical protein